MKQRIITALVLLPLVVGAVLWLPTNWFLTLFCAVLLLGLWEWTRLSGMVRPELRAIVLAVNAGVLAWLAWRGWPGLFPLVTLLGVIWWLIAMIWLGRIRMAREPTRGNTVIKLIVGSMLVVPAFTGAALLHAAESGPYWMLYCLVLVWAADTGAYFVGSRIGGAKLAPSISPGKTWAGLWGGLGGASLVSLLAVPAFGLGWGAVFAMLIAALLTALASVVGDLFESLIKRHSGAKDSGRLVPGHGGVMDRLDSVVAAVPTFAILKSWLLL